VPVISRLAMAPMNLIFVTVYVGHGLNTDLTRGFFDRLRSMPIAPWAPLAGRSRNESSRK